MPEQTDQQIIFFFRLQSWFVPYLCDSVLFTLDVVLH